MTTKMYIGIGIRRKRDDKTLDVYYPEILVKDNEPVFASSENNILTKESLSDEQRLALSGTYSEQILNMTVDNTQKYAKSDIVISVYSNLKDDVKTTEEAYFKLQILSQRLQKPHDINLTGLFGILHNIAWTNQGPILAEDCERERIKAYAQGEQLIVTHVDKFPYLVNYHIPKGTRVASGSQVRLGAYLGDGTTIMPAGYVNFNAGTLGKAMIEGRVSAGVIVGDDSDVGGGASIMGTLSGGNNAVIEIGKSCLLGANAGTGISLGDGCTIAAGLYVYAGMKVSLVDHDNNPIDKNGNKVESGKNIIKAKELSGQANLLFIKDSQTGTVLCKPNNKQITLNEALHTND
ncbi:2,3,4,5-tetrahydropyridine-2,6-dicarboxylate N-succinyltransferase [bacterium]|nr:2,3,4,5-tetrahydropyridine-2,6-dicarboxylate N-succinyltransferase [bacterium]